MIQDLYNKVIYIYVTNKNNLGLEYVGLFVKIICELRKKLRILIDEFKLDTCLPLTLEEFLDLSKEVEVFEGFESDDKVNKSVYLVTFEEYQFSCYRIYKSKVVTSFEKL